MTKARVRRDRFVVLVCLSVTVATVALESRIPCVADEPRSGTARALPRWRDSTGMVFVRGGELLRDDRDKVPVWSFYMDQYEVTNGQYCEFLNTEAGHARYWNDKQEIEKKDGKFVPKEEKDRWPVYYVNVHDAEAYARWAGKRLPTESEPGKDERINLP